MNTKSMLKEIRAIAKRNNLTFRIDRSTRINNQTAYVFVDRRTGLNIISNCTLTSAYDFAINNLD